MTVSRIEIKEHLNPDRIGMNDIMDIIIESDSITVKWSTSGKKDEFSEDDREYHLECNVSKGLQSIKLSELDAGEAQEKRFRILVDTDGGNMTMTTDILPEDIQSLIDNLDLDSIGSDIDSDDHVNIPKLDVLDALLKKGTISQSVYDENLTKVKELEERKRIVADLIENRRYAIERMPEDIIMDRKLRIIDDDFYNMCVWYRRTVPDKETKENTMVSLKLKLSVWGLRIGGRFDTFEFIVDRDDRQMTDRSYCVHGTLFEGCGNYKAPDAARYTQFSEERTENIFSYLGKLDEMDMLGKNYSEARYDCGFFDLYIRYDDKDSVHTKGTTEYPYFIKYLMYLMDAKESM